MLEEKSEIAAMSKVALDTLTQNLVGKFSAVLTSDSPLYCALVNHEKTVTAATKERFNVAEKQSPRKLSVTKRDAKENGLYAISF